MENEITKVTEMKNEKVVEKEIEKGESAKESKAKTYTNSNVTRYKNSDEGKRYKAFLSEKGYKKEEFEANDFQKQGEELKSFFDEKKWTLKRTSQTKTDEVENTETKVDYISLVKRISESQKIDNDKKVELTKKAFSLEPKEKELEKLKGEIESIRNEIKSVL